MQALSSTVILIGILFIALGIGVLVYPPLLVILVSALSIIAGFYIILLGLRVRRVSRSFKEFRERFLVKM